jgi:hypothetical protein
MQDIFTSFSTPSFQKNSRRIPEEFQKNSRRIPEEFQKNLIRYLLRRFFWNDRFEWQ